MNVNYKKKAIEMIENIENERFLKMIYGFVRRLFKEEKEPGKEYGLQGRN